MSKLQGKLVAGVFLVDIPSDYPDIISEYITFVMDKWQIDNVIEYFKEKNKESVESDDNFYVDVYGGIEYELPCWVSIVEDYSYDYPSLYIKKVIIK